ncbi:copper resistance D family protein [Microbulbifer sp. S227A]
MLVHAIAPSARSLCQRYLLSGAIGGLFAASGFFFAQVGSFAGAGTSGAVDPFYVGMLWDFGSGDALALRIVGFLLAALGVFLTDRARPAIPWLVLAGVLLNGVSFTVTGHGAEADLAGKAVLLLHALAGATWMGALLPLWRLCYVLETTALVRVMQRFASFMAWVLALLLACGVYMAFRLGGTEVLCLNDGWSLALCAKLLLVACLLLVAAVNRWRLVPRLATSQGHRPLAFALLLDSFLAVTVLLCTAYLTTLVGPPEH